MLELSYYIAGVMFLLSLAAIRRDYSSRFVAPYFFYGMVSDLLSKYVLGPAIAAVRPAHGPMPPLGVFLVGINQWSHTTDPWVLVIVVAVAFRIRRVVPWAVAAGLSFFALAMGVYHWVRMGYPHRDFDAVIRVDGTSELIGGLVSVGLLGMILHEGFRSPRPLRLGVGHLVMMLQAASIPTLALLAALHASPDVTARSVGYVLVQTLAAGVYCAAFALDRSQQPSRMFTAQS